MHERIALNSVSFGATALDELAGQWRELGARRVSVSSDQIHMAGFGTVRDALRAEAFRLETICHVFMPGRHLVRDAELWRAARASLDAITASAVKLGGRSIYLITGGHGSLTWEQAAEVFAEAIAPCVARAAQAGILLMVENATPLYAHAHMAHSLRDALTLAEMSGIGVCMDFFACWAEAGLQESIARAMPRLHLVQVCDYIYGDRSLPARAVPGDGAIPVGRLIEWLLRAGYGGAFDLELIGPRIDREGHLAATARAAQNVGEILESLGV